MKIREKFNRAPPSGINHGPLKIVNTYYLEYAGETSFYGIETTAYQWTSVKQSIQEKNELYLAGEEDYTLQVIDTWNMKTVTEENVGFGNF